jgi:hypothetical protein
LQKPSNEKNRKQSVYTGFDLFPEKDQDPAGKEKPVRKKIKTCPEKLKPVRRKLKNLSGKAEVCPEKNFPEEGFARVHPISSILWQATKRPFSISRSSGMPSLQESLA